MGKTYKVVVCGSAGAGKTSLLECLLYGMVPSKPLPTIEDTYDAFIQNDRGSREKIRLYDTSGEQAVKCPDSLKYLVGALDAVVLVYDITDSESFVRVQAIKSTIDKLGLLREKKDSVVLVLGTKLDLANGGVQQSSAGVGLQPHYPAMRQPGGDFQSVTAQQADDIPVNVSPSTVYSRAVENGSVQKWIAKEKEFLKDRTRAVELSVRDRAALIEAFCWLVNKLTLVPQGKFPKFKTKTNEDVHK